jgi:putative transposase
VNWKRVFLANAEIAMEPSKAVKEYKEELVKSQEQNERLTVLVGKVTVEKEWLAKKLKSLGSSKLKQLVDLKPRVNHAKQIIKNHIAKVFEQIPIYDGEKKVHKQLLEDGIKVSLNTVARYRQELGLQVVLAVKQVNTTIPKSIRSIAISYEILISAMLIMYEY